MSTNQSPVFLPVDDQLTVEAGNVIEVVMDLGEQKVNLDHVLLPGVGKDMLRPKDGIPSDLMSVLRDLVQLLKLLLLRLGHEVGLHQVVIGREPSCYSTTHSSEGQDG